jgi:iron complex transport system substrate-binding protein
MGKFSKKIATVCCAVFMVFLSGCALFEEGGEPYGIAATSVAVCEILDRLECDTVVGVPSTSGTLPTRYATVTTIGAPMNPDMEILKSIRPEYVLTPKTLESSLSAQYTNAGLTAKFLDLSSVEGLYSEITALGEMLGKEENAHDMVKEYETYMQNYAVGDESPNVLVLMSFPDSTYYLVSTEDSYVGDLVRLAGGNNVYGKGYVSDGTGVASISPEDIVKKDNEIGIDKVLVFGHYGGEEAFTYIKTQFDNKNSYLYRFKDKVAYLPADEGFGMSADFRWTNALDYLQPILYGA